MKLYRIENKNGYGPWSELDGNRMVAYFGGEPQSPLYFPAAPKGPIEQAARAANKMPTPLNDGGNRYINEYFPGVNARVGGTLEQLAEWFKPPLLEYMESERYRDWGFHVAELEVPDNAAIPLGHQIMYNPREAHKLAELPLSVIHAKELENA